MTDLIDRADKLYVFSDRLEFKSYTTLLDLWLTVFTEEELKALWRECQIALDLGFNDEIYNALESLGYFEQSIA